MASNATFAEIAALAGDPARAAMLHALMDGRALTASELAGVAGITAQTASSHLARMTEAGLLTRREAGPPSLSPAGLARRRAHDGKHHAGGFDAGAAAAAAGGRAARCGAADGAHLLRPSRRPARRGAGRRAGGCAAMRNWPATAASSRTPASASSVASASMWMRCWSRRGKRTARVLCRPCLDWSERRPHLAGAVGAALCIAQSREEMGAPAERHARGRDHAQGLARVPRGVRGASWVANRRGDPFARRLRTILRCR